MSAEIKALKEKRGKLITQMKDIMSRADETTGQLSELDDKQWKELDAEQEKLNNQAVRLERMKTLDAEIKARQINDDAPTPNRGADEKRHSEVFGRLIRLNKRQKLSEEDEAFLEKRGTATQVTTTDSLGGYLVPEGFSNLLEKYMSLYGGMQEAATVITTSTGNPFPWPTVADTSNTGAYIDQGTADTVSDVTMANVDFPNTPTITSKVVKVAWELQQDSFFNLENLIAELLGERLGRFSNLEFTTGSTAGKIVGFITGSSSGKTSASNSTFTRLELLDLMHSVDPAYRRSPKTRWMFNDTTMSTIRKMALGTGDARPLWVPSMREGVPDTLEGKPYTINQNMASVGALAKPVAFGDFGKYIVRIARNITLESTRERYWDERVTGFAAICRMDGRLVNTSAIKFMDMPA